MKHLITITLQEWNEATEGQRRQYLKSGVLLREEDLEKLHQQIQSRQTMRLAS